MSRRLPLACLLLALCASALPARADHQSVHVGVLLEGSAPSLLDAWQPLRAALNARVRGHEFELVPLAFDTIQQVVERGEVDFVIVDPAVYATLELRDDVSRIATRLQRENGRDLSRLATLLFTRNDRVDLSRAQDLVEARLAAVHPDSFAGWHLATYTLAGHGADPKGLLESAAFTNFDFAAVAQLVAEGRADAGVLPSGVFEQLVERGVIDPARFKTLGQREIPHFPYRHSSALFPEWAFARLRHTPDDLARQVAVALLDDGIYSASAAGWTTPLDYHSVHEVLMEISAGPYQGGLARMTLERLVDQHQRWFALAMGLLVLIVLATGFTWRLNRRLKHSQARLQKENEERRAAEETLARYGDELEERIRKRTAELEYLAHYDDLTGLPNRNLLFDRLDQAIVDSQQKGKTFALLIVGLDRIREINNTLGHYFGDMILQQAGDLLVKTLGSSVTIARNADDSFVILLAPADADHAGEVAHRIHDALDRTFYLDGHPMHMKAQMGVTLFPEHGMDGDTLMRHADVALHSARRTRMEYALYDPSLNRHGLRDLKLLGDLRGALNSDSQLTLFYQPKVSLRERRLVGVETLLRWNHPQMGPVSPELFIPLAEKTGLIRPLTLWVLNAAFDQASRWQATGLNIVTAINLSAWNLQDTHLHAQVRELLEAWNVNPAMIEMEITESAMMNDPEQVLGVLRQFSEMGMRLSIDDFGTGFSSMSYLKRLPVDEVKIDKSFVLEIVNNQEDRAIVKATIDLGHSLGLSVIAEGVDNQEGLEILCGLDCDLAQGYHIAKPMNVNDLLKWHVQSAWGQAIYLEPSPQNGAPHKRKTVH